MTRGCFMKEQILLGGNPEFVNLIDNLKNNFHLRLESSKSLEHKGLTTQPSLTKIITYIA